MAPTGSIHSFIHKLAEDFVRWQHPFHYAHESFSPFLPLYLTVPSDLGWRLCLFVVSVWSWIYQLFLLFYAGLLAFPSKKKSLLAWTQQLRSVPRLKQLEEAAGRGETASASFPPNANANAGQCRLRTGTGRLFLEILLATVYNFCSRPSVRLPKYIYQPPLPVASTPSASFCASSSPCFVRRRPRRPASGKAAMEAALGALCRAGGWSYAAVWRFHPQDPRWAVWIAITCWPGVLLYFVPMHVRIARWWFFLDG